MPTLQIHFENGDVHEIRAEGYVTVRELMYEYLRARNVTGDEKGRDWTTLHKRTNMALELDRTLDQHGLRDGDELYISRRGNIEGGADLKVHVTSPDGKNHHAEMPPDTATEELLKDLIEVWKLPVGSWELVDQQTGKKLDSKKTLAENGVVTGRQLLLKQPGSPGVKSGNRCWRCQADVRGMRYCNKCGADQQQPPDVKVEVVGSDGRAHHAEMPRDTATEELLAGLIEVWKLPAGNWELVDQQTGKKLDSKKTLAENGVVTGQRLYLSRLVLPPAPQDLKLEVVDPNSKSHQVAISRNTLAKKFLDDLIEAFRLPPDDWALWDEQHNRRLSLNKTLVENGVVTGQQIYLKQPVLPPPSELKLEVIDPNQKSHQVGMPRDALTKRFLDDLIDVFELPAVDWELWDEQRNRSLSPTKTLGENGVTTGHRLILRRRPHFWTSKRFALVIGLVTLAILVTFIARQFTGIAISISPTGPIDLPPSGTQQFTANVKNGSHGVTWSISPEIGEISSSATGREETSNHRTYQAPAAITDPQLVKIVVRSVDDPSKTASAEVRLVPAVESATPNISPASVALRPAESAQFKADIEVNWSLDPAVGTITPAGIYTAPPDFSGEQTVSVIATSRGNATVSGRALISLTSNPPPSPQAVVVSPRTVALDANGRFQFSATVPTPGGRLVWSLNPAIGQISEQGLYTAPSPIKHDRSVTVTAVTNSAGPGTATITLKAVVLTPIEGPASVPNNEAITLRTTVLHSPDRAVKWTIAPQVGSISPQGVYSPPEITASPVDVTVIATSQADPTKSAPPFVIHVIPSKPQITITLNHYNSVMHESEVQKLSATVTGTSNTAVTFSISGGGTLVPAGNVNNVAYYTAPSSIPPGGITINITAVSNADPKKHATGNLKVERAKQ